MVHYSATQIKRILTGSGRAPKSQVQRAIQRELALATVPDPPDVADALAAALCHYYLKDKWGKPKPNPRAVVRRKAQVSAIADTHAAQNNGRGDAK